MAAPTELLRERPAVSLARRLSGKSCKRTGPCKHTEWMSTDDSPRGAASAYFDAWKANDIERVRPLLRTATAGPMAIVNWSHVEDGRITRVRVTFDPRPMLG
jgi:hypothetical protein